MNITQRKQAVSDEPIHVQETGCQKIRASGEDYLEAILVLKKQRGMVRSVDVARHLGFSKPSVSHAVGLLRDEGLLTMDADSFLHLTKAGRTIAESIYDRHQFFTTRLVDLGVEPELAEQDACRIEHVISEESYQKIKQDYESRKA